MVEIELSRIDPVCDFCSANEITKDYDCYDFQAFEMVTVRGEKTQRIDGHSKGKWAACASCAELIDNEKWDELAIRSVDSLIEVGSIKSERKEQMLEVIKTLHDEFRQHRI